MQSQMSFAGYSQIPENMKETVSEVVLKTLSEENCNSEMPIFVSAEGTVCFVGRIYSVAGADYYDHVLVIPPEEGFSDEELMRLAQIHILAYDGYCPQLVALEDQGDGTAAIQLYDSLGDHNSTADWYTVSRASGTGTNVMGYDIDLTVR